MAKMERGIYFDGWYKNNYCYHPSLPVRSLQMVEDLVKYRGTLLVWSALGGGSISLPWLEHEAFGDIDPRHRFYGFINDKEFCEECGKHGIKVFGIVFEDQGWEFPVIVEENKDGKPVFRAINLLRDADADEHDWYGLREFTSDKHWEVFGKKFADYFPDGLYDSDGKQVTNIWEECCSVTYKGEPIHANWVEIVDHKQIAYQMCRNHTAWRAYLKKIIEIQIDAGVHGIQLDEPELPMIAMYDGGCFCIDCVKGFRNYLIDQRAAGKLEDSIASMDLENFEYNRYLVENNLDFPVYYDDVPLCKHYREFQLRQVNKYFKELVDHAREYSIRTRGESVLVSGNFSFIPICYPLWQYVDLIITESRFTSYKQPTWYRFMSGFGNKKSVTVAESPSGIVPELVEMLDIGKGFDLYRLFLLEPAVFGCNMSVPYGSWMGRKIKNAFYPPREVTMEVQNFLADNERLFSHKSGANVAIVWSYPSYYWRERVAGYSTNTEGYDSTERLPFWEAIEHMSDNQVCYDVLTMADGDLREDTFVLSDIEQYPVLILPDCLVLTEKQAEAIESYVEDDRRNLLVFGGIATDNPSMEQKLRAKSNIVFCENPLEKEAAVSEFANAFEKVYKERRRIRVDNSTLGVQTYITECGCTTVHILNYGYNWDKDCVERIDQFTLTIDGTGLGEITVHTPGKALVDTVKIDRVEEGRKTKLIVKNMPLYIVLEFDAVF